MKTRKGKQPTPNRVRTKAQSTQQLVQQRTHFSVAQTKAELRDTLFGKHAHWADSVSNSGISAVQRACVDCDGHEAVQPKSTPVQAKCENCEGETLQTKMELGAKDDVFEQEADAVADKIVNRAKTSSADRDPSPVKVQRSIESVQAKCDSCEEESVQAKTEDYDGQIIMPAGEGEDPNDAAISTETETLINAKRGGGSSLPTDILSRMESVFGRDFSGVRIHTDNDAATLNRRLNAKAFTIGRDIFFSQGRFAPETEQGMHLLGHEITHVVHQGAGNKIRRKIDNREGGGSGADIHWNRPLTTAQKETYKWDEVMAAFEEKHAQYDDLKDKTLRQWARKSLSEGYRLGDEVPDIKDIHLEIGKWRYYGYEVKVVVVTALSSAEAKKYFEAALADRFQFYRWKSPIAGTLSKVHQLGSVKEYHRINLTWSEDLVTLLYQVSEDEAAYNAALAEGKCGPAFTELVKSTQAYLLEFPFFEMNGESSKFPADHIREFWGMYTPETAEWTQTAWKHKDIINLYDHKLPNSEETQTYVFGSQFPIPYTSSGNPAQLNSSELMNMRAAYLRIQESAFSVNLFRNAREYYTNYAFDDSQKEFGDSPHTIETIIEIRNHSSYKNWTWEDFDAHLKLATDSSPPKGYHTGGGKFDFTNSSTAKRPFQLEEGQEDKRTDADKMNDFILSHGEVGGFNGFGVFRGKVNSHQSKNCNTLRLIFALEASPWTGKDQINSAGEFKRAIRYLINDTGYGTENEEIVNDYKPGNSFKEVYVHYFNRKVKSKIAEGKSQMTSEIKHYVTKDESTGTLHAEKDANAIRNELSCVWNDYFSKAEKTMAGARKISKEGQHQKSGEYKEGVPKKLAAEFHKANRQYYHGIEKFIMLSNTFPMLGSREFMVKKEELERIKSVVTTGQGGYGFQIRAEVPWLNEMVELTRIAANGQKADLLAELHGIYQDKIENLQYVLDEINSNSDYMWRLENVLSEVNRDFNLYPQSILSIIAADFSPYEKEKIDKLARALISLGLGIVSIFFPFFLPILIAWGAYNTYLEYEEYMFTRAAYYSSFGDENSLSDKEATLIWVFVEGICTLLDVVELGFVVRSFAKVSKATLLAGKVAAASNKANDVLHVVDFNLTDDAISSLRKQLRQELQGIDALKNNPAKLDALVDELSAPERLLNLQRQFNAQQEVLALNKGKSLLSDEIALPKYLQDLIDDPVRGHVYQSGAYRLKDQPHPSGNFFEYLVRNADNFGKGNMEFLLRMAGESEQYAKSLAQLSRLESIKGLNFQKLITRDLARSGTGKGAFIRILGHANLPDTELKSALAFAERNSKGKSIFIKDIEDVFQRRVYDLAEDKLKEIENIARSFHDSMQRAKLLEEGSDPSAGRIADDLDNTVDDVIEGTTGTRNLDTDISPHMAEFESHLNPHLRKLLKNHPDWHATINRNAELLNSVFSPDQINDIIRLGPITEETLPVLLRYRGIINELAENKGLRWVLKRCASPCFPTGLDNALIARIDDVIDAMKAEGRVDYQALNEYLYQARQPGVDWNAHVSALEGDGWKSILPNFNSSKVELPDAWKAIFTNSEDMARIEPFLKALGSSNLPPSQVSAILESAVAAGRNPEAFLETFSRFARIEEAATSGSRNLGKVMEALENDFALGLNIMEAMSRNQSMFLRIDELLPNVYLPGFSRFIQNTENIRFEFFLFNSKTSDLILALGRLREPKLSMIVGSALPNPNLTAENILSLWRNFGNRFPDAELLISRALQGAIPDVKILDATLQTIVGQGSKQARADFINYLVDPSNHTMDIFHKILSEGNPEAMPQFYNQVYSRFTSTTRNSTPENLMPEIWDILKDLKFNPVPNGMQQIPTNWSRLGDIQIEMSHILKRHTFEHFHLDELMNSQGVFKGDMTDFFHIGVSPAEIERGLKDVLSNIDNRTLRLDFDGDRIELLAWIRDMRRGNMSTDKMYNFNTIVRLDGQDYVCRIGFKFEDGKVYLGQFYPEHLHPMPSGGSGLRGLDQRSVGYMEGTF